MFTRREAVALVTGSVALGFTPALFGAEPWTPEEVIRPADLAKRIESRSAPPIICVAALSVYERRHVRGATFAGPASKPEGMKDLETLAATLQKDAEVVLYCGCCPMKDCPNIRPAYERLKGMGFKIVQVLNIPNSLHNDWITKGYPCEPPQAPRMPDA